MAVFRKKVFKNGLTVILVPMKGSITATALVLVRAGSKYETKDINGISHFLEHLCFKGTVKRPRAIDIAKELDEIGAGYNAFTSQEYTGYFAKSHSRHLDRILDVVSDIYVGPVFSVEEIEKEKGVIVEEINMYEDTPARHVQDLFMNLLYGNQPAGWNIAGEKKIVTSFKREQLLDYRKRHYVASATTVVIAGKFNEKHILSLIEKKFDVVATTKKDNKRKVNEEQKAPGVLLEAKKTDQSHIVLGFRSYGIHHRDNFIIDVMAALLGSGMSSRLFQRIREEMGVGYYVRAYNELHTDHGVFQISAGVDNKRVREVIRAVIDEVGKLKKETVSEDELKKVKDHIAGSMSLELESSDSMATFYGVQHVLKHSVITPREIMKKVREVTPQQIKRVANRLFVDERLNMAMVGPHTDKKSIARILKM
ncbi:MAG: hypothetical protein COZ49_00285 [Candidatus Yonathbacteria bacterium CG_4_10_14_3_um_filter_47_65]|uniref:Peptidase M16 n=2 Tax=Parcubacteria group TaxID=1794811 RepID=A0A2M8D7H4_9BACT|nr:MAG: hypothetical protein AUJ44_01895 [Candidatus Nomurabacteria bacterium CG1_02_47_685]PIP04158.1 MAG: hypothetical protein COX54_00470 [Candidatus Yonathbacteria bacterium CG23_combo_of_CG06-09_8_20_14_all_46_18]PIQ31823.1 MAG: hypothetical protein COW61_02965 [Candidatus Yonathbacteria bacterium CG17_big_fil_post_rev_8_21_14_2_50_46_19]PIX56767.1 MAG: hypothetical protein COZ49_00285 [Candidatus Yonathbacteria bacterium CG_4_10_14_3_um_filter_47_65]PIY57601.1 MAG: hypothetical protein CO